MGLSAKKILGITVTTSPKEEILEYVKKCVFRSPTSNVQRPTSTGKSLVIVTPNPEQIVLAQKDKHFADILNSADVALPDGIGISLAAKFMRDKRHETSDKRAIARIPGVEFMEELVGLAAENGLPIALIGGRNGVAEEALLRLKKKYPGLAGWSWELPELTLGDLGNLGDIGEKIRQTNTKFVFVGLGAPKQEYLIARLARVMSFRPASRNPEHQSWIPGSFGKTQDKQARDDKGVIFMSVGGSFDIIAERTPRAPSFVRTVGLEWLWRLVLEPWRFRRQLALLKFLWLVVKEQLASKGLTLWARGSPTQSKNDTVRISQNVSKERV